jgi:hypothetical protein
MYNVYFPMINEFPFHLTFFGCLVLFENTNLFIFFKMEYA